VRQLAHFLRSDRKSVLVAKVRRKYVNESWAGRVPSSITLHYSTGKDVRDIRINEAVGYIFTSSNQGGLCITDLATGEDLWLLPVVSTHFLL